MNFRNNRYVVVDLEATSTGSKAKIIQVGIVVIEDGEIVEQYATDVNPHEHLDSHIKELTGLTDKRLAKAPEFSQVAEKIFELVKDGIFVAHNVQFDANLLAEFLFFEGYELRTPRIDTVELAQIFYPQLEKYNLGILCQELGIPLEQAHSALSDAQATAELFLCMRQKMFGLPKGLLERLLSLSDSLLYESYLVIEEVYQKQSLLVEHDLVEVQGLFLRKEKPVLSPRKLSKDFQTNIALLDLEDRLPQASFAQKVLDFLQDKQIAFVQAQTGIGKTYGYLLPALALENKEGILLSVPTKILQNQIMQEEAKRLEEVFHLSVHSLKGPQNYLKLDSFYATLEEEESNRLYTRFKMQLLVWLTETDTGDLDEIGQLYRYQQFLPNLVHDGKLSKDSLFWLEDFWKRSQKKARSCQLLVTNHAYLVTRLEDDPSLLEGRLLILDEAQKILLTLENLSQKSFLLNDLVDQLDHIMAQESGMLQRRLMESIRFELCHLMDQFLSGKRRMCPSTTMTQLRQDFSELDIPVLHEYQNFFCSDGEFWLSASEFSSKKVLISSSRHQRMLFSEFFPDSCQLLGISATLEISSRVSLPELLGFPDAAFDRLDEQFQENQEILVVKDFPLVTEISQENYAQALVNLIEEVTSLKEPILVLFTSRELLLKVSDYLSIPHLAQYKHGEPAQLKKRFEKGEREILLGAGSFWEGVDFSAHPRVIEVVTRLPFQNPEDPFTKKMNQEMRLEGKNPFYDYQLPMAIIRLKQALGRTMRHSNQISIVLILDSRMLTKRYGKQIARSLSQNCRLEETNQGQVISKIAKFFKKS
ncbi:bifunctional DnaQ family exonuclease/ATP-dependent helicase [Streptococcus timonensis]